MIHQRHSLSTANSSPRPRRSASCATSTPNANGPSILRAIVSRPPAYGPKDIDAVAFPFAAFGFTYPGRWHFAKRYWYAPERAFKALFNGNRHFRRNRRAILNLMARLAIDPHRTPFVPVRPSPDACQQRLPPQRF
jgi:hypothetical protein